METKDDLKREVEKKRDIRFYVCLFLAYLLLMISLFLPPVNVITTSVLYAAIAILGTGALCLGIDISGILHEVNEMKRLHVEELKALANINNNALNGEK